MRGCTTIETYSQTPFVEQRLCASFVKILSERSTTVWNEANDPAERVIPLFSFLNCSLTEYLPSCLAKKVETDGRPGSKQIISRELILKNQTQSHMLDKLYSLSIPDSQNLRDKATHFAQTQLWRPVL